MKRRSWFGAALAAAIAAGAGCAGGAEPAIEGLILSKGKVASEKQATTPFVTGEAVHCYVTLANDAGGSKLRGRVAALVVDGLSRGEVVDAMTRTTATDEGATYDLTYDEGPLAPGTYEFAVWLNTPKDQAPTRIEKFRVVAKGSVAEATPAPAESEDPALAAATPLPSDDGQPVVTMGPFQEIFLTRKDDEHAEMATRVFQDPTRELWCHAIVKDAKPGQVVLIRFVAEQVAGARREQMLHDSRVMLTKGVDYAQFPLKGKEGGALPKGQWRADLQLREALDTQASIRFTIE